ncbi:MAG: peptidyl-prolyl cis-trans isomerase [Planctomycetaceae bacterium]|nr:peptidyl-prolyl cis-trans isomerase [Planctomycetaceae bacterium]
MTRTDTVFAPASRHRDWSLRRCGRIVRLTLLVLALCSHGRAVIAEGIPAIPAALQECLPAAEDILAIVNRRPVLGADVRVRMLTTPLSEQQQPRLLEDYVQQAIDRELMDQFLAKRKVDVPETLIEERVRVFRERAGGEAGLARMGLDDASLHAQVSLSLRWLKHAQGILTDQQFRDYFQQHRSQLDGTRLRIEQVFRQWNADATQADRAAIKAELQSLRTELVSGQKSFADITGDGADLGWMTSRGNLPTEVLTAAFGLEGSRISEVIESPQGLHIIRVVDRIPGQLSLEDVRMDVLSALSAQLWDEEVARQRKTAQIELMLP